MVYATFDNNLLFELASGRQLVTEFNFWTGMFNNKMGSLELRSQQISEEINYYE